MLKAMPTLGSLDPEVSSERGVFLAASRHEWEEDVGGWTGPLVFSSANWLVAADASLYYLRDLRRRLRAAGHEPRGADSAALVIAALDAWGDRMARYVEGDYALLAYDRRRQRVLLIREWAGQRRLAWTQLSDGTLVVASSPNAVVAYPGVSDEYNLGYVVAAASGFMGRGDRTTYAAVRVVPGGHSLAWTPGVPIHSTDEWVVPAFSDEWAAEPSPHDADMLRALIEDAVSERLPEQGLATVWMSGGSDSTAVFAAGRAALARRGRKVEFRPVSMSFPEIDSGYEDDVIRDIGERWNTPIQWVPLDQIPLFASGRDVVVRDDVMAHTFESVIRTLSRESRSMGARVALEGVGGDHLFHVSDSVLADHAMFGRWDALYQAWRGRGKRPARELLRYCLLPHMSDSLLEWMGLLRGRPFRSYWKYPAPSWVRPLHVVDEESTPHIEKRPDESAAAYEVRRLLTMPHLARVLSWNHAFGLDEGVLVRSPLLDRRVVSFAASRPVSERNNGRGSKLLLRRSMRDLLPESALRQRPFKLGTMGGYFARQTESLKSELSRFFNPAIERFELERLGALDRAVLLNAVHRYVDAHDHFLGGTLLLTLEAERWLVGRAGRL
jgi:asparagine synthase (glutamine-hydrolysing)